MNNIVIMGLPAAGKGTLCNQLVDKYGFDHISTGAILRAEQAAGTKLGKMADRIIDAGEYMPDELMISMVKNRVIDSKNTVGFLFDGFPRTKEQAKHLHAFLFMRKQPIVGVLFLDVDKRTATDRIFNREKVENRADDSKDVIGRRYEEYASKTLPLIDFFTKFGLVKRIPANGTPEETLAEVQPIMDAWLKVEAQ